MQCFDVIWYLTQIWEISHYHIKRDNTYVLLLFSLKDPKRKINHLGNLYVQVLFYC